MSVFGGGLAAPTESSDWDWVEAALDGPYTVSALVPPVFESYARIDHGAAGSDTRSEFPQELLPRLVRFLGALTSAPQRTCFAVWEDYGWNSASLAAQRPDSSRRWRRSAADPFADVTDSLAESREALEHELASLPAIRSTHRSYRVLSGALESVLHMHDPIAVWSPRMPELWWPADRRWFVGSDPDLPATYVGGGWEMVDVLLEGWSDRASQVDPDDPVAS